MMTPRQRLFVQEYLIDHNGAAAARRAGYSVKSAHVQASQLLTNPKVREAIDQGQAQANVSAGITAEMISRELGRLAFANISDIVSWDGKGTLIIKASAELSPDVLAAVAEIAETESKTGRRLLRVKLHSKTTAIELLTRQRIDEDHERRLAQLEAQLARVGKYASLQERNGHEHPRGIEARLKKIEQRLSPAREIFVLTAYLAYGGVGWSEPGCETLIEALRRVPPLGPDDQLLLMYAWSCGRRGTPHSHGQDPMLRWPITR